MTHLPLIHSILKAVHLIDISGNSEMAENKQQNIKQSYKDYVNVFLIITERCLPSAHREVAESLQKVLSVSKEVCDEGTDPVAPS
jgi:hypothetical protein